MTRCDVHEADMALSGAVADYIVVDYTLVVGSCCLSMLLSPVEVAVG